LSIITRNPTRAAGYATGATLADAAFWTLKTTHTP
jgi:hypothetical protein